MRYISIIHRCVVAVCRHRRKTQTNEEWKREKWEKKENVRQPFSCVSNHVNAEDCDTVSFERNALHIIGARPSGSVRDNIYTYIHMIRYTRTRQLMIFIFPEI